MRFCAQQYQKHTIDLLTFPLKTEHGMSLATSGDISAVPSVWDMNFPELSKVCHNIKKTVALK